MVMRRRTVDTATRYAQKVVSGEIMAPKSLRLACQRHLDDLENKNSPWLFDHGRIERLCRLIELALNIHLELLQRFELSELFGWVSKHTGKSRAERR